MATRIIEDLAEELGYADLDGELSVVKYCEAMDKDPREVRRRLKKWAKEGPLV